MKALFRAVRTALALSIILAILPPGPAVASDSLVIWSPTKVSPYSYRLRTGARTASNGPVSAGVDFSVTTSSILPKDPVRSALIHFNQTA